MATSATKSREIPVSHSPEAFPASHYDAIVEYMRRALLDVGGVDRGARLLDFGCGHGLHLAAYLRAGFDAYGCDQDPYWNDDLGGRMRPIAVPYQIPYPDDFFDAVVSTSVLEHAQNTSEVLREIKRVLKPGGVGLHLFPTKRYLPVEPHIFVPLANFFWPKVPRWWLAVWAILGIRNEHQRGMSWRQVVDWNDHYCRKGLAYLTCAEFETLSCEVYGNFSWPMRHIISYGQGGYAALARRLPWHGIWGFIGRHIRIALLLHRKQQ
jgi:SAM-dependent methyltransferase